MLLKKTTYDKLVTKVNNIDTNDFVLKTKHHTDKTELENKIPNITNFVKNQNSQNLITKFLILII